MNCYNLKFLTLEFVHPFVHLLKLTKADLSENNLIIKFVCQYMEAYLEEKRFKIHNLAP